MQLEPDDGPTDGGQFGEEFNPDQYDQQYAEPEPQQWDDQGYAAEQQHASQRTIEDGQYDVPSDHTPWRAPPVRKRTEAELRLAKATYYNVLLSGSIFNSDGSDPICDEVESEIKEIVNARLSVLLGMAPESSAQNGGGLGFSDEDVGILRKVIESVKASVAKASAKPTMRPRPVPSAPPPPARAQPPRPQLRHREPPFQAPVARPQQPPRQPQLRPPHRPNQPPKSQRPNPENQWQQNPPPRQPPRPNQPRPPAQRPQPPTPQRPPSGARPIQTLRKGEVPPNGSVFQDGRKTVRFQWKPIQDELQAEPGMQLVRNDRGLFKIVKMDITPKVKAENIGGLRMPSPQQMGAILRQKAEEAALIAAPANATSDYSNPLGSQHIAGYAHLVLR